MIKELVLAHFWRHSSHCVAVITLLNTNLSAAQSKVFLFLKAYKIEGLTTALLSVKGFKNNVIYYFYPHGTVSKGVLCW